MFTTTVTTCFLMLSNIYGGPTYVNMPTVVEIWQSANRTTLEFVQGVAVVSETPEQVLELFKQKCKN